MGAKKCLCVTGMIIAPHVYKPKPKDKNEKKLEKIEFLAILPRFAKKFIFGERKEFSPSRFLAENHVFEKNANSLVSVFCFLAIETGENAPVILLFCISPQFRSRIWPETRENKGQITMSNPKIFILKFLSI
jgi:hypothetical protein